MYRSMLMRTDPGTHGRRRWKHSWPCFLTLLATWSCVELIVHNDQRNGSYHMLLGPSSSRLMQASSLFSKHVEVRDDGRNGVFLYGFSQRPALTVRKNWNTSTYVTVGSHKRKGFSLWLNKGSKVCLRWEAQASKSLSSLHVSLIKGERMFEQMLPIPANSSHAHSHGVAAHGGEAEYTIEENDRYQVEVMNTQFESIVIKMHLNVAAKMYDTTNARSMCSTANGSCRLALSFPITQFVILSTPNNGELEGWYVELSFATRIVTYVAILGFIVIGISVVLKYLGACGGVGDDVEQGPTLQLSDTEPLMPEKGFQFTYGTANGEDEELGASSSGSSDELYDGKICVICYDKPRNCFFVPCGHCATCQECAKRIKGDENKVCPICRRYIHKLRKLYNL